MRRASAMHHALFSATIAKEQTLCGNGIMVMLCIGHENFQKWPDAQ
jgi:hypothetical protein